MYRPLPNGITIGQSKIEGVGLIATRNFDKGTVLGIAHIANKNFPHGYIRTALGAFYNHNNNPNCKTMNGFWHQIPVKYLVTIKKIQPNDELTAEYSLYVVEEDNWE
jgi:hypothetical protein